MCEEVMGTLPLRLRIGYSVGHVLNDVCASMWFSYLLLYMHFVNQFHATYAGLLLLIGQIADAIATPFVGIESDRDNDWWLCKYGRRKTWHLIGTICVVISFPFLFNQCLMCDHSDEVSKVVYYAAFIVIFQFGWASVQISHLSLIPDLTPYSSERVELNAWRYAFTVSSNIAVYVITWVYFKTNGDSNSSSDQVSASDAPLFRNIVFTVVAIGLLFSVIFHIIVKEKPRTTNSQILINSTDNILQNSIHSNRKWKHWFKESQFYKVALLYMGTRLCINLTQVYTPLFLQDSLHLNKDSIAYIPLVMYCSGFGSSFVMKRLNILIGKKITYFIGSILSLTACTWLYLGNNESFKSYGIYCVAVIIGISGCIMLITSLSITNDLIGNNTRSGAFVFGAMSFVDKLSNGIAVIIIEKLHPCKTCGCSVCDNYYRNVLTFVCGGATILALLALALLVPHKIGVFDNSHTTSLIVNSVTGIAEDVETEDEISNDSTSPLLNKNQVVIN